MDSLLNRLNSNTGLGVASLALMNTLISFNCEDVMFELVFRHLILKEDATICDRESIKDSFDIFLELCAANSDQEKVVPPALLNSTCKSLERCNHACEISWQFDYDGINPSPDYLDKVLDPGDFQSKKPFHGFLDHYSQLLEMRDLCRKRVGSSSTVSRRSNSTSTYLDLNDSCNFTPRSQISRSSSFDTITSMKFDNDLQLNTCLQRLRYPSAEDLLEQKSHYVISYNIIDHMTDDDSVILSPTVSRKKLSEDSIKKYSKGFDLVRTMSDESIESTTRDSGISMEDLECLANSDKMEEFTANLDRLDIEQKELRNCTFSLEDVMNTILIEEEKEEKTRLFVENKRKSSKCSVLSLQSALTIEDNILRHNSLQNSANKSKNSGAKKIATVGLFLHTILERLEKFHLNPFQINVQLTAILISLLSFPQPLIRNYLLNPREQFIDGIKCLYKILNVVKTKIDESKVKRDEVYFKKLCIEARSRLDRRFSLLQNGDLESEELIKVCGQLQSTESDVTIFKLNKTEKRQFNLLEFLSRISNSNDMQVSNGWLTSKGRQSREEAEYNTNLNLAFASILFDELCKEIASFSQEHYVFRR